MVQLGASKYAQLEPIAAVLSFSSFLLLFSKFGKFG
jgi:hypothetical protein